MDQLEPLAEGIALVVLLVNGMISQHQIQT